MSPVLSPHHGNFLCWREERERRNNVIIISNSFLKIFKKKLPVLVRAILDINERKIIYSYSYIISVCVILARDQNQTKQ